MSSDHALNCCWSGGDTEHCSNHNCWKRICEVRHDVHATLLLHDGEFIVDQLLHQPSHVFNDGRCERFADESP